MFNIGFGEIAVICIILIIAVGPERLPSMMKTVGKTMRTLRQASRDIRASTGIDELMREDFLAPRPPVRRPAAPIGEAPVSRGADEPPPAAASPAAEGITYPSPTASNPEPDKPTDPV